MANRNFSKSRKPFARGIRRARFASGSTRDRKRLACLEPANFRAGAPSLADSPVPDYVMFAKEFQSGISLRSTRLNLLNGGDLNCQRAHPKRGHSLLSCAR